MAKENTAGVVDYAKLIRGYDNMVIALFFLLKLNGV